MSATTLTRPETITATAPSTDAAREEGTVARPVPAPPKRRQPRQEAPSTIAVTSLADDPTLAALAAMMEESDEQEMPAISAPSAKFTSLIERRETVLAKLRVKYGTDDLVELVQRVMVTDRDGAAARHLTEKEQQLLTGEVTAKNQGHLRWLLGRFGTPLKSVGVAKTQTGKKAKAADPKLIELEAWRSRLVETGLDEVQIMDGEPRLLTAAERDVLEVKVTKATFGHVKWLHGKHEIVASLSEARRDAEAHRLHMLAGEDASRAPLSQRMMRFREAGRTVQRLLTEEEYQMLVTPVSLETELPRLLFLITVVITSRSAYFGTKGRQVSGTGSVAPKGSVVITRADRRALEPAKVMPVGVTRHQRLRQGARRRLRRRGTRPQARWCAGCRPRPRPGHAAGWPLGPRWHDHRW